MFIRQGSSRYTSDMLQQGPKWDVPFADYPVPQTEYRNLYLQDSGKLATLQQANEGSVAHRADSYQAKPSEFVLTLDRATTLVGHSKAVLWMSCKDNNDLDVYVSIRKLSKSGEVLEHVNVPWGSLPEGINTQHDVPMAQTVKVSGSSLDKRQTLHEKADGIGVTVHWPNRYPPSLASRTGPNTEHFPHPIPPTR